MLNNNNETTTENFNKCQTCDNLCTRKQCKDCYIQLMENKKGECSDCKEIFFAIRNDGTKRKRCINCQNIYNEKHIAKCPLCNNDYHANLDDGRFFDKCYSCYQNTLKKCEKCDKKTPINQPLCKQCYTIEKNNKMSLLSYSPTSSTSAELTFKRFEKKCKNIGCENNTTFSYCKTCYDTYMTNTKFSNCENCGWKFKGVDKLCKRCS